MIALSQLLQCNVTVHAGLEKTQQKLFSNKVQSTKVQFWALLFNNFWHHLCLISSLLLFAFSLLRCLRHAQILNVFALVTTPSLTLLTLTPLTGAFGVSTHASLRKYMDGHFLTMCTAYVTSLAYATVNGDMCTRCFENKFIGLKTCCKPNKTRVFLATILFRLIVPSVAVTMSHWAFVPDN